MLKQPEKPLTVQKMIRIPCRVERPISRTGHGEGIAFGVAESPTGPVMMISVSHRDGGANTAIVDIGQLPEILAAFQSHGLDMAERLTPPPADKAN